MKHNLKGDLQEHYYKMSSHLAWIQILAPWLDSSHPLPDLHFHHFETTLIYKQHSSNQVKEILLLLKL